MQSFSYKINVQAASFICIMKLSKGFIYTFLTSLCWAISIVLARIVLSHGENPYNLAFWTSILAAPYWLYLFSTERKNVQRLTAKDIAILFGMADISSVGVTFVEAFALTYSPAVNYSFLIRMVSVFVIIFAAIFLHEKITRKKVILLATILAGAYLLTTNGRELHLTTGDMFTLLEAMLLAIGNGVLIKLATNRMTPNLGSSARVLIALIPMILIAMTHTSLHVPREFLLVLGITVCDFALTYFQFRAFRHATASFVTMIMSFTPVLVAIMAVPVLRETLSPIQLAGGVLIISAGVLVEKLKV